MWRIRVDVQCGWCTTDNDCAAWPSPEKHTCVQEGSVEEGHQCTAEVQCVKTCDGAKAHTCSQCRL